MSPSQPRASDSATALPCGACKQPVIEKRSADGALLVLDAATKRLHLCVKRKEIEAAKAKQAAQPRPEVPRPKKPLPPPKQPPVSRPAERPRPPRPPKPFKGRVERPAPPVRAKVAEPPRKAPPKRKPRKTTLRSPQQVEEILKGPIVRWRANEDSPTSFCAECTTPVLVGFSHVRWDVMMLDAVGHRPHDCETSRLAAAALRQNPPTRPVDIPDLPDAVKPVRRVVPLVPTISPASPTVPVEPKPRRRPAGYTPRVIATNSCETCGKLTAVVNGERVCLHCGA